MSYDPTTWNDGGSPPIDAAHLNKLETGVKGAHDGLAAHLAAPDPHPQYLTQAKADARYAAIGSGGGRGFGATLSPTNKGPNIILYSLRCSARWLTNQVGDRVLATLGKSAGKWYFEADVSSSPNSGTVIVGITKKLGSYNQYLGTQPEDYSYYGDNGNKYNNNANSAYGEPYGKAQTTIGVAVDLDAGTINFYKNGVSQGVAFSGLSGTFYPAVSADAGPNVTTYTADLNFGQIPFAYAPPAGFQWWAG